MQSSSRFNHIRALPPAPKELSLEAIEALNHDAIVLGLTCTSEDRLFYLGIQAACRLLGTTGSAHTQHNNDTNPD